MLVPTAGIVDSHCGGSGMANAVRDFDHSAIRPAFSTMLAAPKKNGTSRISMSAIVITTTAHERRPPSKCWVWSNSGHVATEIMVAQVDAIRNGRTIQKLLTINTASARSWQRVPAKSG